jgi:hypothetical protein
MASAGVLQQAGRVNLEMEGPFLVLGTVGRVGTQVAEIWAEQ